MILGVDAVNIKTGGGITHLAELLNASNPDTLGIKQIVIWGPEQTLNAIDNKTWLTKIPVSISGLYQYFMWHFFWFPSILKQMKVNLLLIPGGLYFKRDLPAIVISQNMLPHELTELRRYKWQIKTIRLYLLRIFQIRSFKRAAGLIFLTRYANDYIVHANKLQKVPSRIIPHGVNARFIKPPKPSQSIETYSVQKPFRLLYVSTLAPYKHQCVVAAAVALLRDNNIPVVLELIGASEKSCKKKLMKMLGDLDPKQSFITYLDEIAYTDIHEHYRTADLFVFASSCENMPNILLEAMASGLPIACSNRGPMPEILQNGGLYFDPEHVEELYLVLHEMIMDHHLRDRLSKCSFEQANTYKWSQCAQQTLDFACQIVKEQENLCVE